MATLKPAFFLTVAASFAVAQGAGAAGLSDVPNVHSGKQLQYTRSLGGALTGGSVDLFFRMRYEQVSDDLPATSPLVGTENANELSLRTVGGYSTARFFGFYLRGEIESTVRLNSDNALNIDEDLTFPPGPGGSRIAEGHAIIADNPFIEVNQAFIGWRGGARDCAEGDCKGGTTVKLGRQTIIYDNHRWVGNIVWRQNHQSYDALRIDNSSINNFSVSYTYLDKVNRTFGNDSVFDEWELDSGHLINATYKLPFGKVTGYGYLLDFDDNPKTPFIEGVGAVGTPGIAIFDSDTWGVRSVGKFPVSDRFKLLYELEWATQSPGNDAGPTLSDNNYYNVELGGAFKVGSKPVVVKLGREVLEGNGVNSLQTPLATIHAFNGWADKFVGAPGGTATPVGGLVDTSATVVVKGLLAKHIGPSKLVVQYHDFEADTTVAGVKDYGTELGVLFAKPIKKDWLAVAKYAKFDDGGDGFSFDTEKFWLILQYRFK